MSIYEILAKHEIADKLKKISNWLDAHTEVLDWAEADTYNVKILKPQRAGWVERQRYPAFQALKKYWISFLNSVYGL